MNNTTCSTDEVATYEIHLILATTCLTFIVNMYEIYIQQNHNISCQSDNCCNFDLQYSDSG